MSLEMHLEPAVWVLRGYSEPDGFERRAAYQLSATIVLTKDSPKTVKVYGLSGDNFNMRVLVALLAIAHKNGIEVVEAERNGKTRTYNVTEILSKQQTIIDSL